MITNLVGILLTVTILIFACCELGNSVAASVWYQTDRPLDVLPSRVRGECAGKIAMIAIVDDDASVRRR